ncbi:MAG TPA: DMT family transporter [Alphaproteobacteria bacterium]|jgi:drug/metabolite transporter (DMT)-like permease
MNQTIESAAGTPVRPGWAQAYLALAAAALFWGGNWAIARWIQYQVPPQTLGLLRWGMAALLLAPFALSATLRAWPAIRREWPRLVVLGFIGVTGFSALTYTGLAHTTSINGSLLNSAAPVFLLLFSAFGFGERIGPAEVAGVAVSLCGVLVIVSRGDPAALAALAVNIGDLWVLAAVLLWAVYTVLLKRWRTALPPLVFLFVTVVASLPLPIATSAFELTLGGRTLTFDLTTAAVTLYLGLFPSIGAYVCWAYGVARVGPTRATHFQYLIPVFAAGLAILLLDEEVRLFHVAGAALIIGGLVLATRPSRRPG